MRINQNISAMNTHASMLKADNGISKSLERLSSGLRINRAADDAAGLAISEKMRGQIRGLQQATRNAQDGISLLQTAEGNLNETHSILQRMRELAVQASNGTVTDADRAEIQKEMDQLTQETDRIAKDTEFNTMKLLRGTAAQASTATLDFSSLSATDFDDDSVVTVGALTLTEGVDFNKGADFNASLANLATAITNAGGSVYDAAVSGNNIVLTAKTAGVAGNGNANYAVDGATHDIGTTAFTMAGGADRTNSLSLTMQIGANAGQSMNITINNMDAGSLGVGRTAAGAAVAAGTDADQGLDVTTAAAANASITAIDAAITRVSQERSRLGAYQNRLDHTISNLSAASENLSASESRVRDVDMAAEMANFSKAQILMQASTSMMAQANQKPQAVLKLLG